MGVHSTLFGPVKYAILPQHLKHDELIGGNGLVEMGTFVAILLGTIVGGLVVAIPGYGPVLAGAVAVAVAVAGWLVSRGIPNTPAVAPDLALNWNPFTETAKNLRFAYGNRVVWLSMLGISWFWFYGATFLTQFPNYAKDVLGGDEHVVTLLLALFSIGIGVGSLLCERLSGRKVEIGLVPFGSIGLTIFAVDLWFASRSMHATGLQGVAAFLAQPGHWRVVADLMLIGLFGGFYIVPLYALIQQRSEESHRSRIIAANNILNAVFMVASAGLAIVLLSSGLSIPDLFLVTGILNAVIAFYIYKLVPEFLMRFLAWLLIHTMYRVRKSGLDNVPEKGGVHRRVQPRELRRRDRRRRVRAAPDPLHHGPPDLPRAAAQLAVPHDAGDSGRVRARGCRAQGGRVRDRGEGAARRRGRRHLPGGRVDERRRDARVSSGHRANGRRDAGARRADGAVGPVGQLLLALRRRQGDAPPAGRLLAHRAHRRAAGAAAGRHARCAARTGPRAARRRPLTA